MRSGAGRFPKSADTTSAGTMPLPETRLETETPNWTPWVRAPRTLSEPVTKLAPGEGVAPGEERASSRDSVMPLRVSVEVRVRAKPGGVRERSGRTLRARETMGADGSAGGSFRGTPTTLALDQALSLPQVSTAATQYL